MGGCLSRADDASNPFPRDRVRFGPRMNDEHDLVADHAHGMPTLLVRVWVRARRGKRIIEHELEALAAVPDDQIDQSRTSGMSLKSIRSSGRAASASISAFCLRQRALLIDGLTVGGTEAQESVSAPVAG